MSEVTVEMWRLLRHPTRGQLLVDDRPLALTEREVREIVRAGVGVEFASAMVNSGSYGQSFMSVALESSTFNDLMMGMAVAGRLDICETGVLMAMRAAHRLIIRSVDHCDPANGWADVFREWAELAEHLAADLEQRYATGPASEEPDETRSREVDAAHARAARSRRRRDEARSDTAASLAERGWGPAEIAEDAEPRP